jgi:hypothetical protein
VQDEIGSGQVIRAVSESLRKLIQTNITELSAEDAVVFESPAQIDAPGENKLSLFLYQLKHNPYLRNVPPRYDLTATGQPNSASVTRVEPPAIVDLIYLMVPYAKSPELELVITDKLVNLFHNNGEIPETYLHPVLVHTDNHKIQIVADQMFDNLHHIWSGFPNKPYRFTSMYTMSPVRIPSQQKTPIDVVTSAEFSAF